MKQVTIPAPAPADALATATGLPAQSVAASWKDHHTAQLVNQLRDCATSYFQTQQLRERIATIVAPLCAQLKAHQSVLQPAAPQAQADARDAEQERWMGIGKAIERACVDLPAGAEINIHLEKDAGTVTLSDCDGDEQENFPTDEGFAGVVNAAIDAAIAAAKGE